MHINHERKVKLLRLPQLSVVLLLSSVFELVACKSTSKSTEDGMSTGFLSTVVASSTTSKSAHQTTLAILGGIGIGRSVVRLSIVWAAWVRLLVVCALLWELLRGSRVWHIAMLLLRIVWLLWCAIILLIWCYLAMLETALLWWAISARLVIICWLWRGLITTALVIW